MSSCAIRLDECFTDCSHFPQCLPKQDDGLRLQNSRGREIYEAAANGYVYCPLFSTFIYYLLAGRYGEPTDAAGLALFLASPASAHVTGAHILLDGGARFGTVAKL